MKKIFKILSMILALTVLSGLFGCSSPKYIKLGNWYLKFTSYQVANNSISIDYDRIIADYNERQIACKFFAQKGSLDYDYGMILDSEIMTEVNDKNYVGWIEYGLNSTEQIYDDYITILAMRGAKVVGYGVVKVYVKNNLDYDAQVIKEEVLKKPMTETEAKQMLAKYL